MQHKFAIPMIMRVSCKIPVAIGCIRRLPHDSCRSAELRARLQGQPHVSKENFPSNTMSMIQYYANTHVALSSGRHIDSPPTIRAVGLTNGSRSDQLKSDFDYVQFQPSRTFADCPGSWGEAVATIVSRSEYVYTPLILELV